MAVHLPSRVNGLVTMRETQADQVQRHRANPYNVTYQVVHWSANPKWNFRKWRTASFLFFHHTLSPIAQRQHSKISSAFSRNPSYAKHRSNPPGKLTSSISVSLRRRVSALRVTPSLNTMRIHSQAKSVPPRHSHEARSLTGSDSYSAAGFLPGWSKTLCLNPLCALTTCGQSRATH